jgi:uncharacterized protein (TIGR02996 family)
VTIDGKPCDFTNADLRGAELGRKVTACKFTDANLQGVQAAGLEASGCKFVNIDLSGGVFSWANFSGADLRSAKLGKAVLEHSNLTAAKLAGASLESSILIESCLKGAILTGADLSHANLAEANLSGADLSGANLTSADLSKANLTGAVLDGANFDGALLTDARVSPASLAKALNVGGRQKPTEWIRGRVLTSEDHAFLKAIREDPDSDVHRLVYADWLGERSDPRGEFIRVQCELDKLEQTQSYTPQTVNLRRRYLELLEQYEEDLKGPLLKLEKRGWEGWFLRGFVERGRMTVGNFLKIGTEVFEHAPLLRVLELCRGIRNRQYQNQLKDVAASSLLRKLDGLIFTVIVTVGRDRIARDPTGLGMGDEGARTLAASANLAGLKHLSLVQQEIGPEGIRALAASPHLAGLEELILSVNPVGRTGAEALAGSTTLRKLRKLELEHAGIGRGGKRILRTKFGKGVVC